MDAFVERAKKIKVYEVDGFTLEQVDAETDKLLCELDDGLNEKTPKLRRVAIQELILVQAGLGTPTRFGRKEKDD